MFYQKELDLIRKTFKTCRLQSYLVNLDVSFEEEFDMGLRKLIGDNVEQKGFYDFFHKLKPCTLYRVTDNFLCRYIIMLLPKTENQTVFILGPYISEEISREQVYEQSEKIGISPKATKQLEFYYSSLPVFAENSPIFAMLLAFAETIWGSMQNFNEEDLENGFTSSYTPLKPEVLIHHEDNSWNMRMMESRYNTENQLINAVSQGQSHKAEMLFASFSANTFEIRSPDMVRNAKNYCIIMNTLLRKAAETGGVHPIYLDSVSSDFAKKIEQITQYGVIEEFMKEMIRTYCRLVKNHSTIHYSTPVQKAIVKIDSDITADLSLKELAKYNNVSAGYFSGLFKKETGYTLTEFVSMRRIDAAKRLLKNTNLQIQTIAQHCGVLDVNYFSKLFKKHTGKTPREYREKSGQLIR